MANVSIKFNNKEFLLSCEDGQEEHLEELLVQINQSSNEPDIENSTITTDGGYFDLNSFSIGDGTLVDPFVEHTSDEATQEWTTDVAWNV